MVVWSVATGTGRRGTLAAMTDFPTTAIVTGASRGLGAHLATALAARGTALVLAARDRAGLEATQARCVAHGHPVHVVPTDVADPGQLAALVTTAVERLGPIDLLVNNAGVEEVAFFEDLSPEEIELNTRINLIAPMQLARAVLPAMLARDRGHIINMASVAGLAPLGFAETYGATKAGLLNFSRSLRVSLRARGSKVRVAAVCPGFVEGAGMYADQQVRYGFASPGLVGSTLVADVVSAVLRTIEEDLPEVVVNDKPIKPLVVAGLTSPRFMDWLMGKPSLGRMLMPMAEARRAERQAATAGAAAGAAATATPGTDRPR